MDIRRRDVEQFMGDFPYRDSGSWQVQLFLSFVDHLAPSLILFILFILFATLITKNIGKEEEEIFFQLQWYEDSLPYLKQMLRAQYLGVSLAIVICECSLNH